MHDRQDTPADHHEPPRSELDHAGRLNAVLDQIERDRGRPLPPGIRDLVTEVGAAGPFASLADAMEAATRITQAKQISPWELAARMFEQEGKTDE